MSSRSRLTDSHYSTLRAVFFAAKESGYTEFDLRLLTRPKGRVEFCISRESTLKSVRQHDVQPGRVQKTPML